MKQKEYLLLFISVFIIIVFWVIFNIYHNHTSSTIDPNLETTVIPIEGKFDQDAINQIKNRKRVDASLDSTQITIASPSPSLSPTPTPQNTASPSSTLTPTPSQ